MNSTLDDYDYQRPLNAPLYRLLFPYSHNGISADQDSFGRHNSGSTWLHG